LVVDNAHSGVDYAVFDSLGARRELADRDVEIAINSIRRRPWPSGWLVVVQESNPGRKSKHREDPAISKALAQRLIGQYRIVCNTIDDCDQIILRIRDQVRLPHPQSRRCVRKESIANVSDFRSM
jgi:hypothetical protein